LLGLQLAYLRPSELPKESAKKVWQCFSFILLAGEKIILCGDIRLKALEIDQEFLF
jgi:hypothetical protein